jgi:hypothetical protein
MDELTPQQLFTWRREARLRNGPHDQAEALFVPAVVDGSSSGQVRPLADLQLSYRRLSLKSTASWCASGGTLLQAR